MKRVVSIIAVACTIGLLSAQAADNKIIGVFKDWIAQSYMQDDNTVCMMWSQPEKAEGDYTRRGDIYMFLTHRPSESRRNEIRFEAGYNFKNESAVSVTIDATRFTLVTADSTAWLTSETDEDAMVRAMKAGREMRVEGTSSRGTDTRDTYSLHGFTAAHQAINQACS